MTRPYVNDDGTVNWDMFDDKCSRLHADGIRIGAAIAFGLVGMAIAIRARGTDCVLCGKRTMFGGVVYLGGRGPCCGIDCIYEHGAR